MSGRQFNILFLEDDLITSNFVVKTLQRDLPNVKISPAISIKEAHKKVSENPFDLFILDIQLPDGNGIDFLNQLQQEHINVPRTVFMTASQVPEFRQRAQSSGAIHFFEKPVRVKEFAELIRDLLAQQPLQENQEAAFEGMLSSLTPIDLVQLKCLSMASVGLEFCTKEGARGVVFFRDGQVIHAATGSLSGEDAFCHIMSWKSGKITELPLPNLAPKTIQSKWADLVMVAALSLDEGKK